MLAMGGYHVVLQFAKSAVDALALTSLRQAIPEIDVVLPDEAHYRLRFVRPALAFPADAPDRVRLGLGVEGGVALPSGRILSVDAFITATNPPLLLEQDAGWYVATTFDAPDIGAIALTYAGEAVPTTADDLPPPEMWELIRANLNRLIVEVIEQIGPLPLTLLIPGIDATTEVHLRPETRHTGALLLGKRRSLDDRMSRAAIPLCVTQQQNIAILVETSDLATVFATTGDRPIPSLPDPAWNISEMALTIAERCFRFILTIAPSAAPQQGLPAWEVTTLTIDVRPLILDDPWDLLIEMVTVPASLPAEHPAHTLAEAVMQDGALRLALAERLQAVVQKMLSAALDAHATPGEIVFAWPGSAEEHASATFQSTLVYIVAGAFVAVGSIATAEDTRDPEDAASFDLRLLKEPIAGEDEAILAMVTADTFAHMAEPRDVIWGAPSQGGSAPVGHEHTVRYRLQKPTPSALPEQTRRTRSRPLPPGFVIVNALAIDAYGRIARSTLEIDLTGFAGWEKIQLAESLLLDEQIRMRDVAGSRFFGGLVAGVGRRYRPRVWRARATQITAQIARRLPDASPGWTWLAAILALSTIMISVSALVLTHPIGAQGVYPTPTSPKIVLATATSSPTPAGGDPNLVTVTPEVFTPTPTPTPTLPPAPLYGQFNITPTAIFVACHSTTRAPLLAQLKNTGNAAIVWNGRAVEKIAGVAWATLTPGEGSLPPGAMMSVTITPNGGFCATVPDQVYHLQFSAPNAVPLTYAISHD